MIAAVFRREVDGCVNAAPLLIAREKPFDARRIVALLIDILRSGAGLFKASSYRASR